MIKFALDVFLFWLIAQLAEGEGFEPSGPLQVHLISSQARSTTLPSLRAQYREVAALTKGPLDSFLGLHEAVHSKAYSLLLLPGLSMPYAVLRGSLSPHGVVR